VQTIATKNKNAGGFSPISLGAGWNYLIRGSALFALVSISNH